MAAGKDGVAARFLALGDSYTVGEGIEPDQSWPRQLVRRLRSDGLAMAEPEILARTGWTTEELEEALGEELVNGQADAPRSPFDVVTVLVGVNDQYRGRALEEFGRSYGRLLDAASTLARSDAGRVLALSIPDWGVTPFAESRDRRAIAAAIDEFNRVARVEADRRSIRWIDLTPLSRLAAEDLRLVAEDGLHLSGMAYGEWAALIEPEVKRILMRA